MYAALLIFAQLLILFGLAEKNGGKCPQTEVLQGFLTAQQMLSTTLSSVRSAVRKRKNFGLM